MAIPNIPQNFYSQQGNGQVFLNWDLAAGALSYSVQRSLDNITFSVIATPAVNQYLDTAVTIGVQYFYKIASVNVSGTSPYTAAQSLVPTPTAEMSLGELRTRAQQRADRLNSNFVSLTEWNSYINQSMFELYDLLITTYEDYFYAAPISFVANGNTYLYPLPDGIRTFIGPNGSNIVADPFYKLAGVDLALNSANNAYVTVNKFNFIDRNRFVYPNTASTIYGVFNLQYRLVGNQLELIPTPSAGQTIRLWYIPRLRQLLQDNDVTTIGISGWLEYVIVRAAYLALTKEESDTTSLVQQLVALNKRIEESAVNRDVGRADTISDSRQGNWSDGWGGGRNGAIGGW